jgi:hypothetical protein
MPLEIKKKITERVAKAKEIEEKQAMEEIGGRRKIEIRYEKGRTV